MKIGNKKILIPNLFLFQLCYVNCMKGDAMGKGPIDFIRDDLVSIYIEIQNIRKLLEDIEKNTRSKP